MSRVIALDTLRADDVLELWQRAQSVLAQRAVDPKLRADIERAIDRALSAGRIDENKAKRIRSDLDEAHPAVVLQACAGELIVDRPSIGAYLGLRGERAPEFALDEIADFPNAWLRADPSRLADVVDSAMELTSNLRRVVELAFGAAVSVGIDEPTAERIILAALRDRTKGARDVG